MKTAFEGRLLSKYLSHYTKLKTGDIRKPPLDPARKERIIGTATEGMKRHHEVWRRMREEVTALVAQIKAAEKAVPGRKAQALRTELNKATMLEEQAALFLGYEIAATFNRFGEKFEIDANWNISVTGKKAKGA